MIEKGDTMKKQNSAIMQMMLGNRGNIESVPKSDEWLEALKISRQKNKEFERQLKDYPQIFALYQEFEEAIFNENACLLDPSPSPRDRSTSRRPSAA